MAYTDGILTEGNYEFHTIPDERDGGDQYEIRNKVEPDTCIGYLRRIGTWTKDEDGNPVRGDLRWALFDLNGNQRNDLVFPDQYRNDMYPRIADKFAALKTASVMETFDDSWAD